MPGPYDPQDVELWVAKEGLNATTGAPTGAPGTWQPLYEITSYDAGAGTEGEVRTPVFGRATDHVRAGRQTQDYTLNGLLNWDDVGQTILRDAYNGVGGRTWFRRVYPDSHRVTQEVKVTEAPDSADSDGDWVENAFSLLGVRGTRVKDTGTGSAV